MEQKSAYVQLINSEVNNSGNKVVSVMAPIATKAASGIVKALTESTTRVGPQSICPAPEFLEFMIQRGAVVDAATYCDYANIEIVDAAADTAEGTASPLAKLGAESIKREKAVVASQHFRISDQLVSDSSGPVAAGSFLDASSDLLIAHTDLALEKLIVDKAIADGSELAGVAGDGIYQAVTRLKSYMRTKKQILAAILVNSEDWDEFLMDGFKNGTDGIIWREGRPYLLGSQVLLTNGGKGKLVAVSAAALLAADESATLSIGKSGSDFTEKMQTVRCHRRGLLLQCGVKEATIVHTPVSTPNP